MKMIDHAIEQLVSGVQRAVAGPHSEAKVIEAVNHLGPVHPSQYLGRRGPAPEMCAAMERPATFFDTGGKSAGAAHGELRHPECPPDRWRVYGETPLCSTWSIPIVVQTAECNTPAKLSALDQGAIDVARLRLAGTAPPPGGLFFIRVVRETPGDPEIPGTWSAVAVPVGPA